MARSGSSHMTEIVSSNDDKGYDYMKMPLLDNHNEKAVDSSDYSIIKEGKADILVRGNDVFYNEAQVSITTTSGIRDREGFSGKFWKTCERDREMWIFQ